MVRVTCPACRTPYTASATGAIDAGASPRLKSLFLQGRLNVSTCPSCGASGMLSVPVVYHDAEKELLFCLVPQELQVNEADRQRMIGEMSNAIMESLPPDRRRGYLFQPRVFLTYQTMREAILEADGITKEILEAQQEKVRLIQEMARVVDDPIRLASMIHDNEAQIDQEFFALLTATRDAATRGGRADFAQNVTTLLEKLLEQTPTGQQIARQQDVIERTLEGIDENLTQEGLLERVIAVEGEFEQDILGLLVSVARPLLDYRFFQLLTERMDKAQQEGNTAFVNRLKALRAQILDLTQEHDAQVREIMHERAELLSQIAQSADPKSMIRAHLDEIDSMFMSVVEMNIVENERRDRQQAVEMLYQIRNMVGDVIRESSPPEIQFIDRLLRAKYPDETRHMLQENPAMVTPALIETMKVLITSFADRQEEQYRSKLEQVMAQAQLLVAAPQ